jgi:prepilin-type processing-associated H-X9-DG protein
MDQFRSATFLLGTVADQLGIVAVLSGNITVPCRSMMNLNGTTTNLDGNTTFLDGNVMNLDGNVTILDGNVMFLNGNTTDLDGNVMFLDGNVTVLFRTVYKKSQFRGLKSGKISVTVWKQAG